MLSLIIIIALFIGFYTGTRRGLVLQIIHTVGYLLSFIVARLYYKDVAKTLELFVPYPAPTAESNMVFYHANLLFKLDDAFYRGIAFVVILAIGWLLTRFIGLLCHKLTFFPVIKQTNTIGGGALGFLSVYVGIFLLLFLVSMIPLDIIQNQFRESGIARFIVKNTPYFSHQVYQWWISSLP